MRSLWPSSIYHAPHKWGRQRRSHWLQMSLPRWSTLGVRMHWVTGCCTLPPAMWRFNLAVGPIPLPGSWWLLHSMAMVSHVFCFVWSQTTHLLHVLLLFKSSSRFTVTLTSLLQCTSLPPTIISLSHSHTTLTSPSHHLTSPSHHVTSPSHYPHLTSPSHHHNSVLTNLHHSSPCERHPHYWCTQFGCGARDSTAKSGCTGRWVRGPDGSARPAWTQDQPWLWEGGPCQDHQTSRYSAGSSLSRLYWQTHCIAGMFAEWYFLFSFKVDNFEVRISLWFHSKLTCPV